MAQRLQTKAKNYWNPSRLRHMSLSNSRSLSSSIHEFLAARSFVIQILLRERHYLEEALLILKAWNAQVIRHSLSEY